MTIILIAIIVIIIAILRPLTVLEGFENGLETIQHMFPFHNPLKYSFYNRVDHQYKILADSFHRNVLNNIIGSSHSYITTSNNQSDVVNMLNQYSVDFAVVPELSVAPYYDSTRKNVRFAASLYAPVITIMATNDSNIVDLGDIKHYNCIVKIGITGNKYSPQYTALLQLLSQYPKNLQENTKIIFLNEKEIIQGYGNTYTLCFSLVMHPDTLITALSNKIPSHFVSMKTVNGGDYYVTYTETPFYKKYPFYQKTLIDLTKTKQQYPMLTSVNHNDLYLPSLKSRYILLTHNRVSNEKISDIIRRILLAHLKLAIFRNVTVTDIAYMSTAIPHHPGAAKVYRDIKLHKVGSKENYYSSGS